MSILAVEDNFPKERRGSSRKSMTLDVLVSPGRNSSCYLKTRMRDLSLQGIAIQPLKTKLNRDQFVTLCFRSEAGQCKTEETVEARVMHVGGQTIGIRFQQMGVQSLGAINALLKDERYF